MAAKSTSKTMSDPGGNVVPIFKTFDGLQADEQQINQDCAREWNEASETYDAAMAKTAVLKKDMPGDGDFSKGCHQAVTALKALAKLNPKIASDCSKIASDCSKMIANLLDIEMSQRAQKHQLDALERDEFRLGHNLRWRSNLHIRSVRQSAGSAQ
jgi:hypothetical protein